MCSRMENNIRLICFKDLIHTEIITYRCNKSNEIKLIAIFHFQLLLDLISIVLIYINDYNSLRRIFCYLTNKLRTYTSASACYHADLSTNEVSDICIVEFYRITTEKIFNSDVSYLINDSLVLIIKNKISDKWNYLYRNFCIGTDVKNTLSLILKA